MYKLERLDNAFTACIYQHLTFPLFRPLLQVLKPQSSIVAIGASDSNQPIGLALAEIQPDQQSCKVLSIFVKPHYRQQGIGSALLQRLETELRLCNCISAELVYITSNSTTPIFERLLQNCHWSAPEPRMLVGKSTCTSIANAPWMKRTSLPAAYSLFPWQEISPAERIALQQQQQTNPKIPPMLMPFQHEQSLEPLNSLGLRYQGEVVGWIITHRLDPDTIRYTAGFVRPDLQKLGRFISLLANAIQIQIDAKIPFGIWTTPLEFPGMVHFTKNRMAPYLISLEESRVSHKSLVQLLSEGDVAIA
ncbi:MAG: GNAT family N-acetyltransferase [Chroococcidiopsidaceae cyanobacterium CP_BM_RX_35]|nr:GNAT family N-acetyltransferase [Chroococcidiopsidaceae cyanobacterium CP_BM_RX_35]